METTRDTAQSTPILPSLRFYCSDNSFTRKWTLGVSLTGSCNEPTEPVLQSLTSPGIKLGLAHTPAASFAPKTPKFLIDLPNTSLPARVMVVVVWGRERDSP